MTPPRPEGRPEGVSLWRHLALFRRDVLSAQPERLYRAKVAELRTWFFRSVMPNEPELVRRVLVERAGDYPKSARVAEGLRPLLGSSVFLTNGEDWARQRRIIDPAFEGGRIREAFPALLADADRPGRRGSAPGRSRSRRWRATWRRMRSSGSCSPCRSTPRWPRRSTGISASSSGRSLS